MADITDLAQKIAFYQAGGTDPGTAPLDKFNAGVGVVDAAIKDVLAIKKAKYENQKTQAETKKLQTENSPVTEVLGTPAVKSQILAAENAPIPAQDLISGRLDTRQAGIDAASKTAHDMQNTYGNTTVGQYKDLAEAHKFLGPRVTKSGVHRIIDKITGKVIAEYPASEGSGDTINMIGEDTLPTYKKSEILSMSPETRALLGKYKLVDDTAPNKNTDDNQTIDSILNGLDGLRQIRGTMGGLERGATVIPGVAQIGRQISGPMSSWQTQKDLLAQSLGKLVEKNRMSDEDRNFYLKQFNSPASSDEAFAANIDALKNRVASMKKDTGGGRSQPPGNGSLLQNLINKHK